MLQLFYGFSIYWNFILRIWIGFLGHLSILIGNLNVLRRKSKKCWFKDALNHSIFRNVSCLVLFYAHHRDSLASPSRVLTVWDAWEKRDLFYEWTEKAVSLFSLANWRQRVDMFVAWECIRVKFQTALSPSGKFWHRNKIEHVKEERIDRHVQPRDPVSHVVTLT